MRALHFESFAGPLSVQNLPDPEPGPGDALIRVRACGICRSDWHAWMGHDPDVRLPHVPGHELAGEVLALGSGVSGWSPGDRITAPFICACGDCAECASGNQQVCERQSQPGFTHWGAFAEYLLIHHAEHNLVALPEGMPFATAASLGCRFTTAWRAVLAQGRAAPGEWVAVHGCGGLGLSAVMIAVWRGARVIAVDLQAEALARAEALGAEGIDARSVDDLPAAIRERSGGGVQLSLDALGSAETCANSIACLRRRGRHVQAGLMVADYASVPVPMDRVVAHELELRGSHGIQAHAFPELFSAIAEGLDPAALLNRRVSLEESAGVLSGMGAFETDGITVIESF